MARRNQRTRRTHEAAGGRERLLLIALNLARGIERAALSKLASELGAWTGPLPEAALAAAAARLGVTARQLATARALLPRAAARARAELDRAAGEGAAIVTLLDPAYPAPLRELPLPPPVLYLRGEIPPAPAVAMVGSRRADIYGREIAELFAREVAAAGAAVVSGFAVGVDAAAHRGALAAPEGRTVAVLGSGLGVDYPRGHRRLGEEIAARGALVSEFPIGHPPAAWTFPVRNRIIAALAQVTLVVRAAARSGSLITARHALDLGREVAAVPGSIFDDRSLGPNALIRDGALLVQHPRDLLEALDPPLAGARLPGAPAVAGPPPPPGLATEVVAALPPGEERSAEALADATGAPVDRVLGALLELELGGWVKRLPGGAYCRKL